MAVFGRDFYGLSKYGANVYAEFDVNPFDANPSGYGAIRVTWHSPAGSWNNIRLLRSRQGYSVDESDGDILIDSVSPVDHYLDQNLPGGAWYYYTIFIKGTDGVWNRAGATSSMVVTKAWGDTGHADLMWERIPQYFRYVRRNNAAVTDEYFFAPSNDAALLNPDLYDQENQHLRAFLDVLGWGLDWLHNYQTSLLWANDPKAAHLSDVDRLARELGIEFEYGVPAAVMRSKVANAALLARRRGTVDGLKDVAALSTGWDVDITLSPNLMLNRDQSEFANPIFNEWNPAINYAAGQKVQYEGRIFTAKTGGAYGLAQRPPETGTNSNTWWTVTTDTDVTTLHRPDTQGVVTWKGYTNGTTAKVLSLAVGVSDPISGQNQESNALALRNTEGVASTYDVWGAANVVGDTVVTPRQKIVIGQGVPIPRPLVWDPTVEYDLGTLVQRDGGTYKAIGTTYGNDPATSPTYWQKVGFDNRPTLAYSFYGHGPLTGSSGGVSVTPGLAFFDHQGKLIIDQVVANPLTTFVFDSFNHTWGSPDFGGNPWATTGGSWTTESIGRGDDFVAYPLGGTGKATLAVPSGLLTTYRVSVTFAKAPVPGRTDSLAIRYVDSNNYMRVTRTKVQKRVAGTLSDVATLSGSIKDGDRVTVSINDTANTFVVYRNGLQVASGALSGGSAPYRHGMMVE